MVLPYEFDRSVKVPCDVSKWLTNHFLDDLLQIPELLFFCHILGCLIYNERELVQFVRNFITTRVVRLLYIKLHSSS